MKIVSAENFLERFCHEGRQRNAATSMTLRETFHLQMDHINVLYTTEVNNSVEMGKLMISLDYKKRK